MEHLLGTWSLGLHVVLPATAPFPPTSPRQVLGCSLSLGALGPSCLLIPTLTPWPLPPSVWPSNQVTSAEGEICILFGPSALVAASVHMQGGSELLSHICQMTQRGPLELPSPGTECLLVWRLQSFGRCLSPVGWDLAFSFCTRPCKLSSYPWVRVPMKATMLNYAEETPAILSTVLSSFQHRFTKKGWKDHFICLPIPHYHG